MNVISLGSMFYNAGSVQLLIYGFYIHISKIFVLFLPLPMAPLQPCQGPHDCLKYTAS